MNSTAAILTLVPLLWEKISAKSCYLKLAEKDLVEKMKPMDSVIDQTKKIELEEKNG